MALVKLAPLLETRWHAVAADCASRGATLGTVFVRLERTSAHLFIFKGLFIVRHIEDYAMAATSPVAITTSASSTTNTSMKFRRVSFRVLTGEVVELDSGLWLW